MHKKKKAKLKCNQTFAVISSVIIERKGYKSFGVVNKDIDPHVIFEYCLDGKPHWILIAAYH